MSNTKAIIEAALLGVQAELAKTACGLPAVTSEQQLKYFEAELSGMLQDLREYRFRDERTGLGHIVVDSWPLDHDLTDRICTAVQAYRQISELK